MAVEFAVPAVDLIAAYAVKILLLGTLAAEVFSIDQQGQHVCLLRFVPGPLWHLQMGRLRRYCSLSRFACLTIQCLPQTVNIG